MDFPRNAQLIRHIADDVQPIRVALRSRILRGAEVQREARLLDLQILPLRLRHAPTFDLVAEPSTKFFRRHKRPSATRIATRPWVGQAPRPDSNLQANPRRRR